MRTSKTHKLIKTGVLALSMFCLGSAYAQNTTPAVGDYTIGGFLGITDRWDADFTLGGEFEYQAREQWGYGVLLEHTPDVFRNEDATLVMATANFRPNPGGRLKLTGGAGVEFEDYSGDDLRLRFGAGYDLVLESSLTVTPRIAFDFGDGDESIVFGATISSRF